MPVLNTILDSVVDTVSCVKIVLFKVNYYLQIQLLFNVKHFTHNIYFEYLVY